ncbi:MAG: methyl-accepting chemotaxis protein [bacterium]
MKSSHRDALRGVVTTSALGVLLVLGALQVVVPAGVGTGAIESAGTSGAWPEGSWSFQIAWLRLVPVAVLLGCAFQVAVLLALLRASVGAPDGAGEVDAEHGLAALKRLPLLSLLATLGGWAASAGIVAARVRSAANPAIGAPAALALTVLAVGVAVAPLRYYATRAALRRRFRDGIEPAASATAPLAAASLPLRVKLWLGVVLPSFAVLVLVACATLALGARASFEAARWHVDESAHQLAGLVDAAVRKLELPGAAAQRAASELMNQLDRRAAQGELALVDRAGRVIAGRLALLDPRRALAALENGVAVSRLGEPVASGAKLDTADLWLIVVQPSPVAGVFTSLLDPRVGLLGLAGTFWLLALAWLAARDVVSDAAMIRSRVADLAAHGSTPTRLADFLLDDELAAASGAIQDVAHELRRQHRRQTKLASAYESSAQRAKQLAREAMAAFRDSLARVDGTRRAVVELDEAGNALAELWTSVARNVSAVAPLSSATALALEGTLATCDQMARDVNDARARIAELVAAARPVLESAQALRATAESATSAAAVAEDLQRALTREIRASREGMQPLEDQARVVERALATASERGDRVRVAMGDVGQAVHRIEEAVGGVAHSIAVMEEIADRSALLAVNVAILAARSGAGAGGFGIVADEMRDLAQRAGDGVREAGGTAAALSRDTHAAVLGVEAVLARLEQAAAGVREARAASHDLGGVVALATAAAERIEETVARGAADTLRAREQLDLLVTTGQRMLVGQEPMAAELDRSVAVDTVLRMASAELSGSIRSALARGRDRLREPMLAAEGVERVSALTRQVRQLVSGIVSSASGADEASVRALSQLEASIAELERASRPHAEAAEASAAANANAPGERSESSRFT